MHDTEDKKWWVIEGRKQEDAFVQEVAPKIGLTAIINPEKIENPYAADLIVNDNIADLKCQQTPFFKSSVLYRISNQFAVTFNHKDYENYIENYPQIVIYYWIDWQELSKTVRDVTFTVKPMAGIWRIDFQFLRRKIENHQAPLHLYQRRIGDTCGNAKDSYVFDLNEFENLLLVQK